MKNIYKKLVTLGLAITMCIPMAACGGKQDVSTSGKTTKDFVYVPEYQEIAETSSISNVTMSNNKIYYSSWSFDEKAETSATYLNSLEIGSTQVQKFPCEFGENDNISCLNVDKDGNIILVITTYVQGENPEDYSQTFTLKKLDKDGNEIITGDLTQLMGETENSYIQYSTIDDAGNIYLSNGDSKIWVLDGQGTELFTIDDTNYMQGFGISKEGKVVIANYGTEKMQLQEIDFVNKGLGTVYENVPSPNGNYTILKGIDKGCLINCGNLLYEYDFDTQTSKELLNWIDSDIDSDSIDSIAVLEDGRILAITRNHTEADTKTEMVYLTKKSASEVVDKTILTYGTLYMSSNIKSEIINFNKTNETYRIQTKEYGTDDYEAGITQMNTDIVSGNSPDIIDLSNGATKQYMEKGVLEDLYPYFDKDSELKRDDYLENILKAYEKDGKLYAFLPAFGISTVIGKTSEVGDKMGWTLEDLMTLVKSKPEGTQIFEYGTKDSILSSMCVYGMSQFVDWETGKCSFDSDSFVKILEFANTFNSEFVYDENEISTPTKIQSGQLLLTNIGMNDVASYQMYEAMYGEPITFIGYPGGSGNGSAISPGEALLAISSKSSNKDGAWEFVRRFLTSDYQNKSDGWNYPIMKSALQAKMEAAMTPTYYEDENGNQVEETKTSWGYEDFNVDIYAAKQEQVDDIMELINSLGTVYEQDTAMYSIISEEAAAYFSGQKNAKDVATIIQSRVQIYVNENR